MEPRLIEGGIFSDHRGTLSFVNDFNFPDIQRFYVISNTENHPIRAWQGHKLDNKYFYCIQGVFRISYVKIDSWVLPSKDLEVKSSILEATKSNILYIPHGYANAIEALEKDSKLISFATLPLDRLHEDDIRFDSNTWKINGQ